MKAILERLNDNTGIFYISSLPRCIWSPSVCNVSDTYRQGHRTKMKCIVLPQTLHTTFDQFKPDILRLQEKTWAIIDGDLFEVNPGFWFDGMSMPRALWSLMGHPFSPHLIIQVFWHDIFYSSHIFPESKCNDLLDRMIVQRNQDWASNDLPYNIGFLKRKAIRAGLGSFGWVAYNSKTPEQIIGASKHLLVNGQPHIPHVTT